VIIIAGSSGSVVSKKKDGGLRRYVNYCALNLATVRNWYLLPLISAMLDRVCEPTTFTKHDLCGAYNLILIPEGDE